MWSRSLVVGVIASLFDMLIMYMLSAISFEEQASFIFASTIGIIIQFFGNHFWSFSMKDRDLFFTAVLFTFFEVILMIVSSFIFPHILTYIVKELPHNSFISHNGHITPVGSVIIKHSMLFFVFNFISYPVWKYYIFKKRSA